MIGFFINTNCTLNCRVVDLVEFINGRFIGKFGMEYKATIAILRDR